MTNRTISLPITFPLDGFGRQVTTLRLAVCLLLVVCAFAPAAAQGTRTEGEQQQSQAEHAVVVAAATDTGARFTAASGAVVEMRLEVFSTIGEKLFDSDFRRGNIIDWSAAANGQKSPQPQGDSLLFVVTVRTLSGQLRQLHGLASTPVIGQGIHGGDRLRLQRATDEGLSTAQAHAWGMSRQALVLRAPNTLEPEARERFAILAEDPTTPQQQAATVTAHDGLDGQLTSTTGALTFRTGDLFSGKEVERVRITPEGNVGIGTDKPAATLDVAGTIRATGALRAAGGIEFADGTVLTSTGKAAHLNATGEVTPAATGSGSQDRIAKWIDNAGTLGDTQITELNGSVVVGNPGLTGNIQIYGTALQDVFAGMGADVNVGPAFNYGYAGLSFGRSAGFFNVRPDALATPPNPSLRFMTANVQRMIVTNTGDVGIGNSNPVAKLDVVGNIKASGALNSASASVIGNLTVDTNTLHVDAANNRVGVGTITPGVPLDVVGDINTTTRYKLSGVHALSNTGTDNLFAGASAGAANTGTANSFFGASAGASNVGGDDNSFFGRFAGSLNLNSNDNSFFGSNAGAGNVSGFNNSFFGSNAGAANTASTNSFFGSSAGAANTSGTANAFFGKDAGLANVTGTGNSFFGSSAGAANTAHGNSFFGRNAGMANTTGNSNSFFGDGAGDAITSGANNSFFGDGAGGGGNSFFNSFFGAFAGVNATGANNAFFGRHAGWLSTSGASNAFFGESAGSANTLGSSNSFFGHDAGLSNTTEANNTFVGASSNGATGITNATALGANAVVTQSDSLVLGNVVKVGAGTSAPKEKLHILGGNVFIDGVVASDNGLILKSPDGATCAKLTINNAGALVTTVVSCP